ncbi:MAG: energy transducer TonB [Bacteroidaceae bacterium]|nr:energy transducer TonB [Bacteroidaceae bacterium]
MRRIIFGAALWTLASFAFAQEVKISTAETDSSHIFIDYEENAQFPGGDEACFKWIQEHIKYPKSCCVNIPQGRIIVSFIVEKDGTIDSISVKRSPDPLLSKEAIRVVSEMPKWKPARWNGKVIRSRFLLPVIFKQP